MIIFIKKSLCFSICYKHPNWIMKKKLILFKLNLCFSFSEKKFIHSLFPPKNDKSTNRKTKFILLKMIYSFIHSIRLKITIFATLSWAISNFHSNPKTKSTTFFFVSLFLKWLYMWILIRSFSVNQSINLIYWIVWGQ